MYEQHFGLGKHPFTAKATGADVFVGPQTAVAMASVKKALASQDAVITVSGPAGSGKSTIVGKALEAVGDSHRSIRIGRMSLDGSDALEFLLEELGVTTLPKGVIRQFAALRDTLQQLQDSGQRVVIVVEDAVVTGADTMAELEALTAADAGKSDGAAIVIMGDARLGDFLRDPQLARLAQRVRQRNQIAPLSPAELRGYLAHCFRNAGSDFNKLFDATAAVVIHGLCEGNPRMANNIVDASLAAAAAAGESPVSNTIIEDVGRAQFGLESSQPLAPKAAEEAVDDEPLEETPLATEPAEEALDEPVGASSLATESEPAAQAEEERGPDPVIVFSDAPPDEALAKAEIPELIQDTLPDLEILAPEVVATPSQAAPENVPDWDRDPTMAELRPDLDALEKAMAFAHSDAEEAAPPVLQPEPEPEPEPEPSIPTIEEIPEITLDNAIQARIDNKLIDEPGSASPGDEPSVAATSGDLPEVRVPAANSKKADQELERIAAELAKAKSIEDVDDRLAETLFGEELNLVAAQVVANGPGAHSANDGELALFDTGAAQMAQAAGTPVVDGLPADDPGLEPSLREPGNGHDPGPNVPARDLPTPEPIEDQINTSMTQTLKALNVRPPVSNPASVGELDDDDEFDDDEMRGGFFSRFRRS